ncbi:MAG: Fic family protein [Acidobacteria bacterium]|nr:Fic family protein [Acidobacteriota bacterium]
MSDHKVTKITKLPNPPPKRFASTDKDGAMSAYKWQPILPLQDKDQNFDISEPQTLYNSWHDVKERFRSENPNSLQRFTDKLIRSLSVETGILERIYDLDRGTTEALILHGFKEDLVSHSSTNIEPSLLIDILRDQEAAVRLVMDCISNNRQITKGFIHELHATLTKHEFTTNARDQFGNRIETPLRKGAYKELPNNPTRPDGSIHEYCPPIHVDAEMENLLTWFGEYGQKDPVLVAAWLHHRFTQIHPYQDGNGRVARALSILVLLKAGLLPLVIDREMRAEYIKSLEIADQGDLSKLVSLFASLEKKAILQGLSIDVEAVISHERSITIAVIRALEAKFNKRREVKNEELRKVNITAKHLRKDTVDFLEEYLRDLSLAISKIGQAYHRIDEGGPDKNNSHWYKFEVIDSARLSDKWVNFDEDHYFVKATIRVGNVRLVFVISLHHIGRELSGIMEVTAFAFLEFYEEENDRKVRSHKYFQIPTDPFLITWNTETSKILPTYKKWLDASLAVAVKELGDQL